MHCISFGVSGFAGEPLRYADMAQTKGNGAPKAVENAGCFVNSTGNAQTGIPRNSIQYQAGSASNQEEITAKNRIWRYYELQ